MPLRILQRQPEIALDLLTLAGLDRPPCDTVLPGSEVASDTKIRSLNCDNVSVCRSGEPITAAIVNEVQRSVDKPTSAEGGKRRWAWPAYIANVAHRWGVPAYMNVLCFDRRVEKWARGPFPVGQPGFDLRPFVFGPSNFPALTDTAGDGSMAAMAVLSATIENP